jgi:16S rRNA (guanine(527)-N(7))-methyltransferase RsmG
MGPRSTKQKTKVQQRGSPAPKKSPPGLPALKSWFEKSSLPLTEEQYKKLWRYHTLLREKNTAYDLTRIYQFDSMVQKHYVDSVLPAGLLGWRLPSPLLDIGTGAGLPGIPLKIVCPDTHIILSEGRHRRVRFLHEVIEALDLKGIEIHAGKIHASYDRPVQGVITRAVEPIGTTLARVRRCLVSGGKAIFMKGPSCDPEIHQGLNRFPDDYTLAQDLSYDIPHSPHRRRLLVFQRFQRNNP